MTTAAVLWLCLKRRPTLPLFAVASPMTVRYTVVREASSTEETSSLSHTVASSAAAAPRFPPPLAASFEAASHADLCQRQLPHTPSPPLVCGAIPHGRPRRLVLGSDDPCGHLVATSSGSCSPSLPRRTATTCPTDVRAALLAETTSLSAVPWPHPNLRPSLPPPLTSSSGKPCPTAVRADSPAEAQTPATVPWSPPRRRHPSTSPSPVAARSATTPPTAVRAASSAPTKSPRCGPVDSLAATAPRSPPLPSRGLVSAARRAAPR